MHGSLFSVGCLLCCSSWAFGQATVPYHADFQGAVGSEWSARGTDSVGALGRFLGPFDDGATTTLSLMTSPRAEYELKFDLFIFDDWDGTAAGDVFTVRTKNQLIFSHAFSGASSNETFDQNQMWLDRYENIGYGNGSDLILRDVTIRFAARGARERIKFAATLRDDRPGEGWGIDNVRLVRTDAPDDAAEGPLQVSWVGNLSESDSVERVAFSTPTLTTRERQVAWLATDGSVREEVGADRFAWRTFGGLVIPREGSWSFRLSSDDGATLRIDDEIVINNDGRHSLLSRTGKRTLAAGTHEIDVRSFEWTGSAGLILEWKGPSDKDWSVIPPSAFVYVQAKGVPFTDVTAESGIGRVRVLLAMSQGWNDLNNDGYLDAVIGGYQGSVLLGRSDHTFQTVQSNVLLFLQTAMADVDNDGDLDLLSAYTGLHLNNGAGRFSMQGFPGAGISYSYSIAAPDFDGDGRCDLAATDGSWPKFARAVDASVSGVEYDRSGVSGLMLGIHGQWLYGSYIDADVDDDGDVDVIRCGGYEGVWLMRRMEDRYALSQLAAPEQRVTYLFSGCSVADFDSDGDLDIFDGSHYYGTGNGMLVNQGGGVFVEDDSIIPDCGKEHWCGAEFGDVDNDGDVDVLLRSFYDSRVVLRFNDGKGKFAAEQELANVPMYVCDARLVDYDNDGDLDVCMSGYYDLTMLRNDTDDDHFLKVRLIGRGAGGTNAAGVGTCVELIDSQTGLVVARRDVTSTTGTGAGPFWVHFGVDPSRAYVVRAHFLTGVVEQTVTPALVSSVVGGTTVAQMVTLEERAHEGHRVARWRETNQLETLKAALKAEGQRRGLGDEVRLLVEQEQDTIPNLLGLLGARSIREALGSDSAVLVDLTRDPAAGR